MATSPASEQDQGNPIVDVFFSPSAAMDSLAKRPRFVLPLIILTVLSIASGIVALNRGVVEQSFRRRMESEPRMEQLPAEQRERIMEQSGTIGKYSVMVGSVVGPAIGMLAVSGVLILITNVILGASVRFKQMVAVVTHSWMPMALSSLIGIPIMLLKDPENVDMQNIVAMSNLSFLFSPTEHHKLHMLGSAFDLFAFWVMAVLVIGLSRLTGRSKGTLLGIILVPWAVYVLVFKVVFG